VKQNVSLSHQVLLPGRAFKLQVSSIYF